MGTGVRRVLGSTASDSTCDSEEGGCDDEHRGDENDLETPRGMSFAHGADQSCDLTSQDSSTGEELEDVLSFDPFGPTYPPSKAQRRPCGDAEGKEDEKYGSNRSDRKDTSTAPTSRARSGRRASPEYHDDDDGEGEGITHSLAWKKVESLRFPAELRSSDQLVWYRRQHDEDGAIQLAVRYVPAFLISTSEAAAFASSVKWRKFSAKSRVVFISYAALRAYTDGRSLPEELVPVQSILPFDGVPLRTFESRKRQRTSTNHGWSKHLVREYKSHCQSETQSRGTLALASNICAEVLLLERMFSHATASCKSNSKSASQTQGRFNSESASPRRVDETGNPKATKATVSNPGHKKRYADPRGACESMKPVERDNFEMHHTAGVSDDESELEEPYSQNLGLDSDDDMGCNSVLDGKSKEPIRPGDVVRYYTTIGVAGDSRAERTASVLSVDPNRSPILVLDNGDFLPQDTHVQRIKVMTKGQLEDHPGVFRPICYFKLQQLTGPEREAKVLGVVTKAKEIRDIVHKHQARFERQAEKDGFAPNGFFRAFGKQSRRGATLKVSDADLSPLDVRGRDRRATRDHLANKAQVGQEERVARSIPSSVRTPKGKKESRGASHPLSSLERSALASSSSTATQSGCFPYRKAANAEFRDTFLSISPVSRDSKKGLGSTRVPRKKRTTSRIDGKENRGNRETQPFRFRRCN